MRTRDHEELAPLVNLADITEIELFMPVEMLLVLKFLERFWLRFKMILKLKWLNMPLS